MLASFKEKLNAPAPQSKRSPWIMLFTPLVCRLDLALERGIFVRCEGLGARV